MGGSSNATSGGGDTGHKGLMPGVSSLIATIVRVGVGRPEAFARIGSSLAPLLVRGGRCELSVA